MKRYLHVYLSLTVLCFLVTFTSPAQALTRYVNVSGCGGTPAPCYTAVNDAVDASSGGDIIYIYPGVYTNDLAILGDMVSPGDITLITVNASGVPTPGTATITNNTTSPLQCNGFTGNITVNGLILECTDPTPVEESESGLYLINVTGNITLTDVDARSTSWDAMAIYGCTGNVTITRCAAHDSYDDGFSISGGTIGNLTIRNSTAENNNDDGFSILEGTINNIIITDCTASGNDDGFNVDDCLANITMTRCTAENNNDDGFNFYVEGDVRLTDCLSENNDDPQIPDDDEDGFDLDVDGNITVDGCTAQNNGQEGIDIEFCSGVAEITDSTSQGNGGEGIDTDELGVSLLIENSRSLSNTGEGIEVAGIAAPSGGITISCCDITGNNEGLHLYENATVQAINNWWGNTTGPDASDNPGGTGDSIVIDTGTVNYTPWLTTPFSQSPICGADASIPTTNTWGLIIMTIILALAAFKFMPRRQGA
ncbi:MAG: right-handed parallel beta-helix repeat-containing protein [Desulfosalsimonadaceae bacterium]|nr:right-handed parallel beta-helix repeat-containing protein [Desulfosalsimonadaceae bacterium]